MMSVDKNKPFQHKYPTLAATLRPENASCALITPSEPVQETSRQHKDVIDNTMIATKVSSYRKRPQ